MMHEGLHKNETNSLGDIGEYECHRVHTKSDASQASHNSLVEISNCLYSLTPKMPSICNGRRARTTVGLRETMKGTHCMRASIVVRKNEPMNSGER
jgi:hypothetical protein